LAQVDTKEFTSHKSRGNAETIGLRGTIHAMNRGQATAGMQEQPANYGSFDVALDWLKAVITTVKCNWGIGMMAMPYLLLKSGFGAGIILFVLAMWLSWLAIVRLSDCRKMLRERGLDTLSLLTEKDDGAKQQLLDDGDQSSLENYSDIVRACLGDFFGDASIASILIAMYGSNISYIVFIKQNMVKFVGHLTGLEWVLVTFAPLTLLVLRSDLDFLAPVSVLGIACAISFLALLVYHTAEGKAAFLLRAISLVHLMGSKYPSTLTHSLFPILSRCNDVRLQRAYEP
jgi:amino acid permease